MSFDPTKLVDYGVAGGIVLLAISIFFPNLAGKLKQALFSVSMTKATVSSTSRRLKFLEQLYISCDSLCCEELNKKLDEIAPLLVQHEPKDKEEAKI